MSIGSSTLSLFRKTSQRLFRREEDARLRGIADVLEEIPLFSSMPRGMMLELAGSLHERTYRKDEHLYYEGDPGIGLYIIRSGSVRLLVEDSDGSTVEIGEVGPNGVLGATCLLGGGIIKRAESAQSVVQTEVLGLFSPEYRTLQRRHPKSGAMVATLLARHFAQCLTETRTLLGGKDGPVAAARCLMEAGREAVSHSDLPPGW